MQSIAYESGNRRAEIDGEIVVFSRVTGNVRRSKKPFWWVTCADARKAKAMAQRWVNHGKMAQAAVV